MKPRHKYTTITFRVLVGLFATVVLCTLIYIKAKPKKAGDFIAYLAFFGLLFGYAFGGDRWGARLFGLFTGHRVHVDDSKNSKNHPREVPPPDEKGPQSPR